MDELMVLRNTVSKFSGNVGWLDGGMPRDFLVVDIETLGFQPEHDKVVQLGLCFVRDLKPHHEFFQDDYLTLTLRWPADCFIGKEGAIGVHGIDANKSREEGVDPVEAFSLLADMTTYARANRMLLCGHNLYSFDLPFLQTAANQLDVPLVFDGCGLLDTALLVKTMRMGIEAQAGERPLDFWKRARNLYCPKGMRYNLDNYCMSRFSLSEKYGVSSDQAHDAGYDCFLTYLVVKELSELTAKESA